MASVQPTEGRCNAKTRGENPGYCERYPLAGKTRCRLHGGKSTGTGQLTHGRHSKYAPERWLPGYLAALQIGDNVLSLNEDICLIEGQLEELLRGMNRAGHADLWDDAQKSFRNLDSAIRRGDKDGMRESLASLRTALESGSGLALNEQKWLQLVEAKRRLAETEAKRLKNAHDSLSKEQVILFLARVANAIEMSVRDSGDRQRLRTALASMAQ